MRDFKERLQKEVLILDGSMGAYLQSRGLPSGYAPDLWNLEKPEEIEYIQRRYVEAGADILLTNTFGATRHRLAEYSAAGQVREINFRAVEIARRAGGEKVMVGGDIGPSGLMLQPLGETTFDQAVEIFQEQIGALLEAGVDLLVIETMFDLQEIRAAVIAANELRGNVPLIVHATFNEGGLMDTGTDPETFAVVMEALGVDAIGMNCSVGPDKMLNTLEILAQNTSLPLSVEPNAGIPIIEKGRTVFPLSAEEMAAYAEPFYRAGANIIGGCCGTTPEYIRLISRILKGRAPVSRSVTFPLRMTSRAVTLHLGSNTPFVKVGEKINPTGKKKFAAAIKDGRTDLIEKTARKQVEAGADALDVNVGVPLINEAEMMARSILAVQQQVPVPLWLDSSSVEALEAGLKNYCGKAVINSVNAEEERLEQIIPLARKYGAVLIALLTGEEIPVDVEGRLRNAHKIVEFCQRNGFDHRELIFDAVALTVSAMQEGAIATLKAIQRIKSEFNNPVSLGLSNISFGLPARKVIHQAFLSQAIASGLDAAILDPYDQELQKIIYAASLFTKKDPGCKLFIYQMESRDEQEKSAPDRQEALTNEEDSRKKVYRAVLEGDQQRIIPSIQAMLDEGYEPLAIFSDVMTPAIRHLGELFSQRKRFIPHLIASAETMKKGMNFLTPLIKEKSSMKKKGRIVFATVKGDIHDIGKNICIMMLENAGFKVYDLGKSVEVSEILKEAEKHEVQIVALSALMTTTMPYMKVVIDEIAKRGLPFRVMVGGAAVTPAFAKEIGADGYGRDVGEVVQIAERLISKKGK